MGAGGGARGGGVIAGGREAAARRGGAAVRGIMETPGVGLACKAALNTSSTSERPSPNQLRSCLAPWGRQGGVYDEELLDEQCEREEEEAKEGECLHALL